MSTQYLSRLKKRLGNYARLHYLQSPWCAGINPTELSTLFTVLEKKVEAKNDPACRINVGHKVTLFDVQEKDVITVLLVNPGDSHPEGGRISCLSPLGRQIIGRITGDVVEIKIFCRTLMFRIIRIEH